jgi:hypothetical protein
MGRDTLILETLRILLLGSARARNTEDLFTVFKAQADKIKKELDKEKHG